MDTTTANTANTANTHAATQQPARTTGSTIGRVIATIFALGGGAVAAMISLFIGALSSLNCIETCSEGMYNESSSGPAIGVIVAIIVGAGTMWATTRIWTRD